MPQVSSMWLLRSIVAPFYASPCPFCSHFAATLNLSALPVCVCLLACVCPICRSRITSILYLGAAKALVTLGRDGLLVVWDLSVSRKPVRGLVLLFLLYFLLFFLLLASCFCMCIQSACSLSLSLSRPLSLNLSRPLSTSLAQPFSPSLDLSRSTFLALSRPLSFNLSCSTSRSLLTLFFLLPRP